MNNKHTLTCLNHTYLFTQVVGSGCPYVSITQHDKASYTSPWSTSRSRSGFGPPRRLARSCFVHCFKPSVDRHGDSPGLVDLVSAHWPVETLTKAQRICPLRKPGRSGNMPASSSITIEPSRCEVKSKSNQSRDLHLPVNSTLLPADQAEHLVVSRREPSGIVNSTW